VSNKKAQRARERQNYEQHPPRCSSCSQFAREQRASKAVVVMGQKLAPPLQYLPAHCKIGGFAVSPGGICDEWEHRATGEVLEGQPQPRSTSL
jgi:hypothetical protein